MGRGNEGLFAVSGSLDKDSRPAHMWLNHSKIVSGTNGQIFKKLGMWNGDWGLSESNDDTALTLTYLMAMSTLVACVVEWGKLFHGHLMGTTCRKLPN